MRILYVEDNDDNIYMLIRRLEKKGFETVVARNGLEGVEAAISTQPDLIIMDLHMPVLDGWQAMQRIKDDPATKHIPIIALSADAMLGDAEKAISAGADAFETKPLDFPGLLTKIQSLLKNTEQSHG